MSCPRAGPLLIAALAGLILGPTTSPAQIPSGPDWPIPVEARVPFPPTPVKAAGEWHLVYELHLSNLGSLDLAVVAVEVLDAAEERTVAKLGPEEVPGLLGLAGPAAGGGETEAPTGLVGGGRRGILYLWITVPDRKQIPKRLLHRIGFQAPGGDGAAARLLTTGSVAVADRQPAVLGPPLRGGGWWIAGGLGNGTGHRRTLVPQGKVVLPSRFGADLIRLGEAGLAGIGGASENRDHLSYGAEVLAVADGIVAAVMDGIPENRPGSHRAVPITGKTVAGNHVILDLGNGRFALYAHLRPGSLRVQGGERVKRGQVLGLVGSSGDSSRPHLHFRVTDDPSLHGGEGLPFVFGAFVIQDREYRSGEMPDLSGREARRNEIPLEGQVIRFRD